MIARCSNLDEKNYGARGITVCDRWRNSFASFLADMGPRPSPKHSIDRYPNNNGNYEPGNCRWATDKEQARNTRRNVVIEFGGISLTTVEWAARLGISRQCLNQRLNKMPPEVAVSYSNNGTSKEREKWLEEARKTWKRNGRPRNPNSVIYTPKLNREQRKERRRTMAAMMNEGRSIYDICKEFDVTPQTVFAAVREFA